MMDFFAGIIEYFALLWAGITNALWLNPQVFEVVEQSQQSRWVVAGIVFLAGASTLLGQSAVLFINRVRRSRFVISLITNGIIFIISYVVWGLIVWLIGRVLFSVDPPLGQFVRAVGLSTAPLVFGLYLILLDGAICRQGAQHLEHANPHRYRRIPVQDWILGAVICVVLGWLASLALTNTIGKPIVALRNKVFQMVSGSKLDSTAEDILLHFSGASVDQMPVPTSQGGAK